MNYLKIYMRNLNESGWVRLHRKIADNPLWTMEPFTKGQAWIDLFLNANFKDGYFYIRGNKVIVKRGQIGWSELTMAKRWRWSRNKVRRFLFWLQTEQQIIQQKDRYLTSIITILNYDIYQYDTADDTAERQQTIHKQEWKESNNTSTKVEGWVKPTSTTPSLKGDVFAPKYGNKDINLILGALSRLNTTGKLDSSEAENRKHAQNLLKKYGKDEILRVIKALPTVPFWSGKVTSAGLLLRHFNAIINSLPKKQEYTFL